MDGSVSHTNRKYKPDSIGLIHRTVPPSLPAALRMLLRASGATNCNLPVPVLFVLTGFVAAAAVAAAGRAFFLFAQIQPDRQPDHGRDRNDDRYISCHTFL